MSVPIRVRGMSTRNKYFDEQTETALLAEQSAVIRLRNLVDLETELHVMSLKNQVGGAFRVVWVNTREEEGFHLTGLELMDPEGDLWELGAAGPVPENGEQVPEDWLECRRCRQKALTPVPEVPAAYLQEGLLLARHCEACKATTAWTLVPSGESGSSAPDMLEGGPPLAGRASANAAGREDLRAKGRAPLEMFIKVVRHKYGITIEDICKTTNISRNGVYFLTAKNYEIGETVQVILPYKEGDVVIPVPASVVRLDQPKGTFEHGVALRLQPRAK